MLLLRSSRTCQSWAKFTLQGKSTFGVVTFGESTGKPVPHSDLYFPNEIVTLQNLRNVPTEYACEEEWQGGGECRWKGKVLRQSRNGKGGGNTLQGVAKISGKFK